MSFTLLLIVALPLLAGRRAHLAAGPEAACVAQHLHFTLVTRVVFDRIAAPAQSFECGRSCLQRQTGSAHVNDRAHCSFDPRGAR